MSLVLLPQQLVVDANGAVRVGAKLYVYDAGTTDDRSAYTTSALSVAHPQPVVSTASGLFPAIHIDPAAGNYKLVLTDSADVTLWTEDNIVPSNAYAVGNALRYQFVGDGVTNNDAALAAAVALGIDLYFPEGDYLVTDFSVGPAAGTIWTGPGRIVTATSHRRTWEYGNAVSTGAAETWYVNPSTGDDSNDGRSSGAAFRTINRAIQQLAPLIRLGHQQTIQLADGTYSTSDVAAGDMARPAIAYLTGVYAGDRSDDDTGLVGSLVIKGTSKAGTILQTGASFTYGLYCSQVPNVAVDSLTIKTDGVNTAQALVTAHRGCYVQLRDVVLDGDSNCINGLVAEAGGVAEVVGASEIRDCTTGVVAFDESLIVLSNTTAVSGCSSSALGGRGTITLNNTVTVSGAIASEGLTLVARGTDTSNRVTISSAITGYNMRLYATFANLSGALDLSNCDVMFNVCGWSEAIILRAGAIRLRGATTSYISPASASTVASPLTLLGDAQVYKDSTVVINGSASKDCATRGVLTQAVSANATAINFQAQTGRHMVTQLTANGAYTGCTLAADSSDFSLPADDGDLWTIIFSGSNSVAIVDSTTADLAGGAITLGLGGSQYNGITLVRRTDGKWHEVSRSGAN